MEKCDGGTDSAAVLLKERFGMAFNADGVLKQVESDGSCSDRGFVYDVFNGDRPKNQERYEAMGKLIDEVVYEQLERVTGLERVYFPEDGDPKSFFFVSPGFSEASNLLILIHGSGVVRAGQWARKLIINNGLTEGTQLPFIQKGKELGYGIVVLNTNDNKRDGVRVDESRNPVAHASYVWKHFVETAKARQIVIVAHSFGGVVTLELAMAFQSDFLKRVSSVLLTDSVHDVHHQGLLDKNNRKIQEKLSQIGLNYAASDKDLDVPIRFSSGDIPKVSAGHPEHEWTSFSAMKSIFKVLEERAGSTHEEL